MNKWFSYIASVSARYMGHPLAFIGSCVLTLVWFFSGPFFGWSDTWQLYINTGTTVATFLMVFLIQNSQNRDGIAIQAKLDELIRSSSASNELIKADRNLTEDEIEHIRDNCEDDNGAPSVTETRL